MSLRVVLALMFLGLPGRLPGQDSASMLLVGARECFERVRPDSVRAINKCGQLARRALDPVHGATQAQRGTGYALLAVWSLYDGDSASARDDLRLALRLDPEHTLDSLAHLHEDLGPLAQAERRAWVRRDTTLPPVTAPDTPPAIIRAPRGWYARSLVTRRLEGQVELLVVIDTMGRVEPSLLYVVSQSDTAFDLAAMEYALKARFRPALTAGRPTRVAVRLPLVFDAPVLSELEADEAPVLTDARAPQYPESLLERRIQGCVVAEAIVDTLGRAERNSIVVIRSAHADLDAIVVDFMQRAKFRPARLNRSPVRVLVRLPVRFVIVGGGVDIHVSSCRNLPATAPPDPR